jgi:hypothetical protein
MLERNKGIGIDTFLQHNLKFDSTSAFFTPWMRATFQIAAAIVIVTARLIPLVVNGDVVVVGSNLYWQQIWKILAEQSGKMLCKEDFSKGILSMASLVIRQRVEFLYTRGLDELL